MDVAVHLQHHEHTLAHHVDRRTFIAMAVAFFAHQRRPDATFTAGTTTQVLLIRHAEETGDQNDVNLSSRGYQRARALPKLFPTRLPTPQVLFAARSSKQSQRPVETLTPLAKALGVSIDVRFSHLQYATLAKELLNPGYGGETILVCWHHETLPALAAALGVRPAPRRWPGATYDHVWSITIAGDGAHLTDLPQRLLPGDDDSTHPR